LVEGHGGGGVPDLRSIRADELIPGGQRIRITKHEAVPGSGSFEVRFPDDRPSQFFYWDDVPARRFMPELLDRDTALEKAKAVARAAREEYWSRL